MDAASALPPLPSELALRVLALLPADDRLLLAGVSRAWRAALATPALWLRLDLSPDCCVTQGASDGLLRAAVARAGGRLQSLHVPAGITAEEEYVSPDVLRDAVAANGGALRELHLCGDEWPPADHDDLAALLERAPHLRTLEVDQLSLVERPAGTDIVAETGRMLRRQPPFGPLRARLLYAAFEGADPGVLHAWIAEVAAALPEHPALRGLRVLSADFPHAPGALDALVDAAVAGRLRTLRLVYCQFDLGSTHALARLLRGGALAELAIDDIEAPRLPTLLAGRPPAAALTAALRDSRSLTSLSLAYGDLWAAPAAAVALLRALEAHPTLRTLNLSGNRAVVDDAHLAAHAVVSQAVGALYASLISANSAALTELDVSRCGLGDDGLRPLFDALACNTHLRTLSCYDDQMSAALEADALLPALQANTTLRKLRTGRSAPAAEALVAQRT